MSAAKQKLKGPALPSPSQQQRSSKEFSPPEYIVDILNTYPDVLEIAGRVVKVKLADMDRQGVSVISAGGVLTDPSLAGYVGHGLLRAFVCGDSFSCPPSSDIVKAIESTTTLNWGCLLVGKGDNSTKRNFEEAASSARERGHTVEILYVPDNVAFHPLQPGRGQGGAGMLLVLKVAGAAATSEKDLTYVLQQAKHAYLQLGAIGVLSSSQITDHPQNDKVVFGIGLDGEKGVYRDPIPLHRLIKEMVDRILLTLKNPPAEVDVPFSSIFNNPMCAVMVNCFGQDSFGQAKHILAEVVEWMMKKYGCEVPFKSLGMVLTYRNAEGFSLTIMRMRRHVLDLLMANTSAPFWGGLQPVLCLARRSVVSEVQPPVGIENLNPFAVSHAKSLRSLICAPHSKELFWRPVRGQFLANEFLQTILRGLLKLSWKLVENQNFPASIINVDNICYLPYNYDDPEVIIMEGGGNSKDWAQSLIGILFFVCQEHGIDINNSPELFNFNTCLKNSRCFGFSRIANHIFLKTIEQRIDLIRRIVSKMHGRQNHFALILKKTVPYYSLKDHVKNISARLDPRYWLMFKAKETYYQAGSWLSVLQYIRNMLQHANDGYSFLTKGVIYKHMEELFPGFLPAVVEELDKDGTSDFLF